MQETFMKVADVAQVLNLSRAMVYRLIQHGRLPCLYIGTAVRIHPDDLDKFILENMIQRDDISIQSKMDSKK
jgi:excisionase family DNA binding protein